MKKVQFLCLLLFSSICYTQQEIERDFMQAISDGACDAIKLSLISGINPNLQNEAGDTALLVAVTYNRVDLVDLLIKTGADVTLRNNDRWTPLQLAEFYDKAACYNNFNSDIVHILKNADIKNKGF